MGNSDFVCFKVADNPKDAAKHDKTNCSSFDEKRTASVVGSKCKIYQLKSFLEVLVSDEKLNCKILVKKKSATTVAEASIKSFILNPAHMFSDVVKESRSVILAGGQIYLQVNFVSSNCDPFLSRIMTSLAVIRQFYCPSSFFVLRLLIAALIFSAGYYCARIFFLLRQTFFRFTILPLFRHFA